jgi:hypothetical protein
MCKKQENKIKIGGSSAQSTKIIYKYDYVQVFREIYEVLSKQWHFKDRHVKHVVTVTIAKSRENTVT